MKHRAVCIVSKGHAQLVDVPPPRPLGPAEVRGRTLHTLVSPGTELAYYYTGDTFPSYPGYAATFEVDEVGADVKGLAAGDLCSCMGPHRSYQQVDCRGVHRIPTGLPTEKAVLARLMGVSMTTLVTTKARPGDRVVVVGAGPVGFLASQMFGLCGYDVAVVEPDEARRRHVEKAGIRCVHGKMPVDDSAIAGDVALVAECSGHERAVLDACKIVRKGGEVVLVGVPWRRQTDASAHELLSLVFHKYVVLRSGWEWDVPLHATDASPHSIHTGFATALRWLAEGSIRTEGLVTLVDPHEAQRAYQDLLHRRAQGLFTIFDWRRTESADR